MITVREWSQKDLGEIAVLETQCFGDPWKEKDFQSVYALPIAHGVVVEEDGKVIGYAIATFLFEDGEILNVAVSPNYRRQGLAKRLLSWLEERAESLNVERLFLEVRVSNDSAKALYVGYGFEKISVRKKYYENGEDALVMQKNL